jgi:hypothetical protein
VTLCSLSRCFRASGTAAVGLSVRTHVHPAGEQASISVIVPQTDVPLRDAAPAAPLVKPPIPHHSLISGQTRLMCAISIGMKHQL